MYSVAFIIEDEAVFSSVLLKNLLGDYAAGWMTGSKQFLGNRVLNIVSYSNWDFQNPFLQNKDNNYAYVIDISVQWKNSYKTAWLT